MLRLSGISSGEYDDGVEETACNQVAGQVIGTGDKKNWSFD